MPCDLTSEDFDLPIQEMKLLVRFGDTYNDNEEIVGSSIWRI
jgi:hypothetical protein